MQYPHSVHQFTNAYYTYRSPHTGSWRIRIERNFEGPGIKFYEDLPDEFGFLIPTIQKINEVMQQPTSYQDYLVNLSCLCFWIPWHISKSSQQLAFKRADEILMQENAKLEKKRWTLVSKTVGLFLEFEYLE